MTSRPIGSPPSPGSRLDDARLASRLHFAEFAVILLAAGGLASCVAEGRWLRAFDRRVSRFVQRWRGSMDDLMMSLSQGGNEWSMASAGTLLVAALSADRRPRTGAFVAVATSAALAGSYVLRHTIPRQRPVRPYLLSTPSSFSFPSGHAAGTTAAFGSLLVALQRSKAPRSVRWAASSLAGLLGPGVGLSRIYFGVHYPSDVLGGQLAGALALLLAKRLVFDRPQG